MIIDWLKRILGFSSSSNTEQEVQIDKQTSHSPSSSTKHDWEKEMDKRIASILKEKKELDIQPTDWYEIEKQEVKRNTISTFQPYLFLEIVTLSFLKQERLKREAKERKLKEENILNLLDAASGFIKRRDVTKAKEVLDKVLALLVEIKNYKLDNAYSSLVKSLESVKIEIEAERLAKIVEQQRREREELQKRLAAENKAHLEKEQKEKEERQRREAEAQKRYEENRKKEEIERRERQHLDRLSSEKKEDWEEFLSVLRRNGIKYLYHFTDVRNLASIKRYGGLFSWKYCDDHGIVIPCQGGDDSSRYLDTKYGLQDYVRLSFCNDHPMAWRLQQSGSEIKVLRIKIDVALLKDTLFSDINAADSGHTHGSCLEYLENVNFSAVKRNYVRKNDPDFKPHQAEVMVKTFIPLKYIENI